MPSAATQEAPKPYQQEQAISEQSESARNRQREKALAALGQEGTYLSQASPFGSQEQQKKSLLGG
ncbi:MAG: hypothetical protein LBO77_03640 [Desulfovibrio sp.]|jgi:hypothetical protein|nr:hypothetical protein [Desulfovibrio sp.]